MLTLLDQPLISVDTFPSKQVIGFSLQASYI